jgi:P-type Ca2+ transporter type 2C
VPDAVEKCKKAGIIVRMITGDNLLTAKHIAKECGILTEDGLAIEGPKFRKMSEAEIDEILPKLQVIARAAPTDKYTLVHRLRQLGEVVAVTGTVTLFLFIFYYF